MVFHFISEKNKLFFFYVTYGSCYERGASADQLFKKNIIYCCFRGENAVALKARLHSCIKVANDSLQPDRVSPSVQEAKTVCRRLY